MRSRQDADISGDLGSLSIGVGLQNNYQPPQGEMPPVAVQRYIKREKINQSPDSSQYEEYGRLESSLQGNQIKP